MFFRSLLLFSYETGGSPAPQHRAVQLWATSPGPSAHRSHLQMTLPGSVRGLRTYFVTLPPSAFLCVCLSPGPASQLAPPGTEGLEQKGALPAPHPFSSWSPAGGQRKAMPSFLSRCPLSTGLSPFPRNRSQSWLRSIPEGYCVPSLLPPAPCSLGGRCVGYEFFVVLCLFVFS